MRVSEHAGVEPGINRKKSNDSQVRLSLESDVMGRSQAAGSRDTPP